MTNLMQRFDMRGSVAVVTGAVGFLGQKHCEALAEAGANVVALDLDVLGANTLAERLNAEYGGEAIGMGCDITDEASVDEATTRIMASFGRIDALVNNARKLPTAADVVSFEDLSIDSVRRDLRVTIEGTLLCSQKMGARMAQAGGGSIVNISSMYGLVAPNLRMYEELGVPVGVPMSYSIGKSALIGMTKHLAAYWGKQNVRVNLLAPGGVRSEGRQSEEFVAAYAERTPLARMSRDDELKGAIVFLCSQASSYMTGANLVIDGGWTAW
jgi:NAD(P)-dependent dehydrogenase (short-subunit alcohol dehydrogenase family)